ncbi:acyltransferase family protein [Henriciella sp.]|uniref:acyltransferase family protein n=1 Tax=Henriciella sp. TaxID=1968823 RepID=UPI002631B8DD|nr:acyltransferase family protein [Henriciella sp.]
MTKKQHLYGLDLVRFGSAFLVLLFHLSTFGSASPSYITTMDERAFGWLGWVGAGGWVGVEVFFVISGFVIAASAEKATARDFIVKRGIRVFPALWICSLIALSVQLAWGMPLAEGANAFFRSAILSPQGPYIDGVVWTLVLEAVFYVYVAALILIGARLGRPLLDAGGLLLGGVSAVFIAGYLIASGMNLPIADTLHRFPFKVALLWHGVFFALGMLIRKAARTRLSAYEFGAVGLFTLFCLAEITSRALKGYEVVGGNLYEVPLALGIWLAAMGVIIASVFRSEFIARHFGAPWVKKTGLMTYPLYLNHFAFGMCLTPWLAAYIPYGPLLFVAVVAIVLAAAWAIMSGPEAWLQTVGRKALIRRKAQVVRFPEETDLPHAA